jgi:mRNA interferase MazF
MEKDFNRWNLQKQALDVSEKFIGFHEREIWWCSIGVNVGSEQYSQTGDFSRPVLIVRKFTANMFWGIPLTTKINDKKFRFRYMLEEIESDALLLQMRAYDRKRLVRKIGTMTTQDFERLKIAVQRLL